MSRNTLLVSVATMKAKSAVHLNVDDKIIAPEIKTAQDIEIVEAIGSALMERLQDGIEAGAGDGKLTEKENILLKDYIADALINFTMAAMALSTSFQFYTKGILRTQAANSDMPSISDLDQLGANYRKRGEFYRERMITYLRKNSADFPLYRSATDQDIKPASSSYNMPCYLPDDDC